MLNLNEHIRMSGQEATVLKTTGDIETHIVSESVGPSVAGRRRLEPERQYESGYLLPTDCQVSPGDLMSFGGNYHLVMSLTEVWKFGIFWAYRGMLYRCNAVISVYYYNSSTGKVDQLHRDNVRCLVTQARVRNWSDDAELVFDHYRSSSEPFWLYAQADAGVKQEGCIIIDQDGRQFRVGKDGEPYITDGIMRSQILWED